MNNIPIFGGTGFIGLSLAQHLIQKGFHPILIARHPPSKKMKYTFVQWDAISIGEWTKVLENALAVVNLTGRTVDCIKTPENCDVILRSRVDSTKIIGEAMHTVKKPPKTWIQMSTAHIYGDPPEQICTEQSTTGFGLAPFVAKAWEEAFLNGIPNGVRGVRLRTSFVIGKNGGAMKSLKRIVRMGMGGKVGHGKQGISWIHEYDMNEIIHQAIVDTQYQGVYIVSSPHPVSNAEFMRQLRMKMGVPIGLPAPEFMVRLGARWIFKTDSELALYGRYVIPERLLKEEKYVFKFTDLEMALADLID